MKKNKKLSVDKNLRKIAEEDRNALLNEKDVEFLKSIGVEVNSEALQNVDKKNKKR